MYKIKFVFFLYFLGSLSAFPVSANLNTDSCKKALVLSQINKTKILLTYARLSKNAGYTVGLDRILEELGHSAQVEKRLVGPEGLFTSFEELKRLAYEKKPDAFKTVVDSAVISPERREALITAVKNKKRLILTTAVAGAPVNKEFFSALRNYAKRMDAEIVVFPANMQTTGLDPILLQTPQVHILTHFVELTPYLNLNRIMIPAKQANPFMRMDTFGARGQSQILGSPKMNAAVIATADNLYHPHRLFTTGSVTDPQYEGDKYYPTRLEQLAENDHVMGALILEKTSNDSGLLAGVDCSGDYHIRHVEFISEKSGFEDLDVFYTGESVKKVAPVALVLGDTHVGDHDEKLLEGIGKLIDKNPQYVVLHDFLNGASVNHHEAEKLITLSEKAEAGLLNVEAEIKHASNFINAILARNPKVIVVIPPSNHPMWINRWLQSGQFMREPENTQIGLDLAQAYKSGMDPVKYAILERDRTRVTYPKRVVFTDVGVPFKVGPENRLVHLSVHGHIGANGLKNPGINSIRKANDRVVFGHTHTVARVNGAVNVGTNTKVVLSYNKDGVSSWVQGAALVGEDGQIQLLEFQNGEWYTDSRAAISDPQYFFKPGYPKLKLNRKDD